MAEEEQEKQALAMENEITERLDHSGQRWTKVYFGGGTHFQNWLDQVLELRGKENVEVEEVDAIGLKCFEEGDEKMYRIWVKDSSSPIELT